jgi:tRNA(Arg) A34 adenosine deaminase TadA
MQLAVSLSRENVRRGGGPFGAAVFELDTHKLIAPGANLVVPTNCSVAHAEMVAIMVAQQVVGSFDLGRAGLPALELVTSTEPCIQCFGGLLWSGIKQVVCGARAADAEAIGFDEGPKPADWVRECEDRKICVIQDVLRDEASAVLRSYKDGGGPIYNASR